MQLGGLYVIISRSMWCIKKHLNKIASYHIRAPKYLIYIVRTETISVRANLVIYSHKATIIYYSCLLLGTKKKGEIEKGVWDIDI